MIIFTYISSAMPQLNIDEIAIAKCRSGVLLYHPIKKQFGEDFLMWQFVSYNRTKRATAKTALLIILLLIISPTSYADGGRRLPYAVNIGDAYISNFYAPRETNAALPLLRR